MTKICMTILKHHTSPSKNEVETIFYSVQKISIPWNFCLPNFAAAQKIEEERLNNFCSQIFNQISI